MAGLFGGGTHPVEVLDLLLHGLLNLVGHDDDFLFGGGREVAGDKLLAESLPEIAIDLAHAALPAGLICGMPRRIFGVEVETGHLQNCWRGWTRRR